MTVLITAPGVFASEGGEPKVGRYYTLSPCDAGSEAQHRAIEAMISELYFSGGSTMGATSLPHYRALCKLYYGSGVEKYRRVVDGQGNACEGREYDYRLKSLSTYTKKERMEMIEHLILEGTQAGVNSPKWNEIMDGLERKEKDGRG